MHSRDLCLATVIRLLAMDYAYCMQIEHADNLDLMCFTNFIVSSKVFQFVFIVLQSDFR